MSEDKAGAKKIMLVHETALQSWARDAGTVIAAFALILPGWWLEATWVSASGFFIFWAWIITASTRAHRKHTFTIEEARAEIERIAARKGVDT